MPAIDWPTLLVSTSLSGVIATAVSIYFLYKRDLLNQKRDCVRRLMAYRFNQTSDEFFAALNEIPVTFDGDKKVITAFEALRQALRSPVGLRGGSTDSLLAALIRAAMKSAGLKRTNETDDYYRGHLGRVQ